MSSKRTSARGTRPTAATVRPSRRTSSTPTAPSRLSASSGSRLPTSPFAGSSAAARIQSSVFVSSRAAAPAPSRSLGLGCGSALAWARVSPPRSRLRHADSHWRVRRRTAASDGRRGQSQRSTTPSSPSRSCSIQSWAHYLARVGPGPSRSSRVRRLRFAADAYRLRARRSEPRLRALPRCAAAGCISPPVRRAPALLTSNGLCRAPRSGLR